jgi:pimeloyl-ACP methyl ester carboxylesterase
MPRIMRINGNTSSLTITISLLIFLLIPSSARMVVNTILDKAVIAYGQVNKMNSNLTNQMAFQNIPPKKVHVGDIDIAYRIFGKGEPLLLIPGFSQPMDTWDPVALEKLSSNHTIIISDYRGIGETTVGNKTWSTEQFANDTAGLIDALGIRKPVDVLGFSRGGHIAQELALMYPQKVNKLILYGTDCGGKATILSPQIIPLGRNIESGNMSIDTLLPTFFPKEWLKEKENAAYVQKVFSGAAPVPKENIQHHNEAAVDWKGSCDRLSNITKPTLVIVGTDDIVRPPANSLMLAEKIPGAWLVQIKGGGHGLMYQYPDKFSRIVLTFLET